MNIAHRDIKDEFDKIWDKVVIPLLNSLSAQYPIQVKRERRLYHKGRRLYHRYRNVFLRSFMYYDTDRIDKHKIASCYMKVILAIRPVHLSLCDWLLIRFNPKKYQDHRFKDIETIVLMNQYLSLSVATSILNGYIQTLGDDDSHTDQPLTHRIYFPKPFRNGNEEYLRDVCLDLYYTRPGNINTVTYANVFFLLEKYSCRKVQCENLLDFSADMLREEGLDPTQIEEKLKAVRFKSRDD